MDKETIIRLFKKYDLSISVKNRAEGGVLSISAKELFEIFEHYGDDVERFEIEQIHGITHQQYEELQHLIDEKCIRPTYEYEGKTIEGNPLLRCCGTTKKGDQCRNTETYSSLQYISYKDQLDILRNEQYFCKTHTNQRDALLRKATSIVYKGVQNVYRKD